MKRTGKILKCIAVLLLICISMSGCADIGLGSQSVLRPPRATGNEAALQEILNKEAGASYTLKYPQTGEYRAAVTFFDEVNFLSAETNKDKDSSKTNEQSLKPEQIKKYAIAFYSIDNETGSQMYVSFMERKDQKWRQMGKFPNSGSGVDRVLYQDITGDGKGEFLIGWTSYSSSLNSLTAYSVDNGDLREMTVDETYSDLLVENFTGDMVKDVLLLSLRTDKTPSTANLLQYDRDSKRPKTSVSIELDSDVVSFQKIAYGKIDSERSGVFVDCKKEDGNYVTQVLHYEAKTEKLLTPLTPLDDGTKTPSVNPTIRKDIITSRDINNDGKIEVPIVSPLFSAQGQNLGDVCNITAWMQINSETGTLENKMNTVIDYADGYYFVVPTRWVGKVTGMYNHESRVLYFYMWNSETASIGDKLLEIHRFRRTDWEKSDHSESVKLLSDETKGKDYVIAGQIFTTYSDDSININDAELEKCVRLV